MTFSKLLFAKKGLHHVCLINEKSLPESGYLKLSKLDEHKIFKIIKFIQDPFQREDVIQVPEYLCFRRNTEVDISLLEEDSVPLAQQATLECLLGDDEFILDDATPKIFTFKEDEIHFYHDGKLNIFRVVCFSPDSEGAICISSETEIIITNPVKSPSKEELAIESFELEFEQKATIQFVFDLPKCLERKAFKTFSPKLDLMQIAEIPELEDDSRGELILQTATLYYVFFAHHIRLPKSIDKLVNLILKYRLKLQIFMTFNEFHPLYVKLNNSFDCSSYFFPPLSLDKIRKISRLFDVSLPATKFVGLSLDDLIEVLMSPNLENDLERVLENSWSQFGQVLSPREYSWAKIIGYEEKIQVIRNYIFAQYKQPEMFKEIGLKAPRGILLYGPSGCGKTLIARTLASENLCTVIEVRSVQLYSKYFGETEERIRQVFSNARLHSPCILIFDEFDAFGVKRSVSESADTTGVSTRVLTTLLTELDGIHDLEGVTVIACTNRRDTIDEALLRPGRLDVHVEIGLPDARTRMLLLRAFLSPYKCSVDLNILVDKTADQSGGKIKMLINNALFNSLLRESQSIDECDIDYCILQIKKGKK